MSSVYGTKATEIEAARPKRPEPGSSGGINFHQRGSTVAGRDGVTHENITCYKCNKNGHYPNECQQQEEDETKVKMRVKIKMR